MAVELNVEIVTPDRVRYEGTATCLTLPGSEGQMGILAHHEPIVALLNPGLMRVETSGETRTYASGEGFVQVRHNRATVIVEFAETAEELKRDVVQKDLVEAEKALAEPSSEEVRRRKTATLMAARARLALLDAKR